MLQANNVPPIDTVGLLATPSAQDDVDIGWLISAIRRRLWLIVALMAIGAAAMMAYVALRPANYSAFTQLQLTNLKLTFSRDDAFYAESQSDPTFLETQIQIMRSGKIALDVVDRLKLAAEPATPQPDEGSLAGLIGSFRATLDETFGPAKNEVATPPDASSAVGEALKKLQRSYSVERVGLSNIVEIRYTAQDREMAARGANEIAQSYIADQQAARIEAAQSASIWLRERLRDVGPRTRIVAAATPPKDKSDPRGVLIIALGCIAGGVIGVMFALLRQFMDRSARTPEQAEAAVGAECLGVVPKLRATRAHRPSALLDENVAAPGGRLMNEALNQPFGALSRTLQNAKAAIEDKCGATGARCIGVTSTYSGEGASTVAVNLARRLASLGERVLLVDCNVARPILSSELSPAGGLGLYELNRSKAKDIDAFIRQDSVSDMKFLPLGDAPSNHVIWTETTPKFLTSAARSFDYVICDLPPLSAMGEVRASAHHFDAFLMVLRWGAVDIDHLKFGLKSSGAFREKIAGVILNRAHPASLRRTASPSAAFFMRKPNIERRAH